MPHPHRGILLMIVPSFPEIFPIRLRELHDSLPRRPACHTASFLARPRLDARLHELLGKRGKVSLWIRLSRDLPYGARVASDARRFLPRNGETLMGTGAIDASITLTELAVLVSGSVTHRKILECASCGSGWIYPVLRSASL